MLVWSVMYMFFVMFEIFLAMFVLFNKMFDIFEEHNAKAKKKRVAIYLRAIASWGVCRQKLTS